MDHATLRPALHLQRVGMVVSGSFISAMQRAPAISQLEHIPTTRNQCNLRLLHLLGRSCTGFIARHPLVNLLHHTCKELRMPLTMHGFLHAGDRSRARAAVHHHRSASPQAVITSRAQGDPQPQHGYEVTPVGHCVLC
jgi:hypothetical protein